MLSNYLNLFFGPSKPNNMLFYPSLSNKEYYSLSSPLRKAVGSSDSEGPLGPA